MMSWTWMGLCLLNMECWLHFSGTLHGLYFCLTDSYPFKWSCQRRSRMQLLPLLLIQPCSMAGAAGLIFQASLLMIVVAVYLTGSVSQKIPFLFFLCLIVLSRLGHMSYDVVGAQILHTGILASKANLIGITEASVASLIESVMLGIVIIVYDVSHFGFLAVLSLLSVVWAASLYCRWLKNQTETQRSLFSFEPSFT